MALEGQPPADGSLLGLLSARGVVLAPLLTLHHDGRRRRAARERHVVPVVVGIILRVRVELASAVHDNVDGRDLVLGGRAVRERHVVSIG